MREAGVVFNPRFVNHTTFADMDALLRASLENLEARGFT